MMLPVGFGIEPPDLLELCVAADRRGLRAVGCGELAGPEAFSLMGAAAATTGSVRLETGVVPASSRSPALLAMAACTLAALSEDRFVLGIGAGSPIVSSFHGEVFERPLGRVAETLAAVKAALAGERLADRGGGGLQAPRHSAPPGAGVPFGHERADAGAGARDQARAFLDTDEQQWRTTLAVNLVGPMLATQLCLPPMVRAGGGAIVAITSEAARVGDAGNAVYAAAKAGMTSFLRTIAREHGRDGVRANAVAPGPIDTSLLRHAFAADEAADAAIAKLTRLVPLRRLGRPEEVAAAVRYLVSEGTHVTGQHLGVGGGVVM